MNRKLIIAAAATIATIASIGNAVAGELYGPVQTKPVLVSTMNDRAAGITGGELYGLVEHQQARIVMGKAVVPATPASYALGGEWIQPVAMQDRTGANTHLAE